MVDRTASPGRSRRDDILAAAEREFAVAGFAGARVERIAAAANVNKQLLFHYFASKDGLFSAALASLLGGLSTETEPSATPLEQMRAALVSIARTARAMPGLLAMLAGAGTQAGLPAEAAAQLTRWRDGMLDALRRAVEDGQRRGYFRDDVDPSRVATLAAAAALGSAALVGGNAHSRSGSPQDTDLTQLVADYCAWR